MTKEFPSVRREGGKGETAILKPTKHTRIKRIMVGSTPPSAPALSWDSVVEALPAIKLWVSAFGWLNSAGTNVVSTIQLCYGIYYHRNPTIADAPIGIFILGLIMGVVMFVLLTGGQIVCLAALIKNPNSRGAAWGYRLCLLVDAGLTAYQWSRWIIGPFFVEPWIDNIHGFGVPSFYVKVNSIVASIAGSIVGLTSAKLPEYLTFGKRPAADDDEEQESS